MAKVTNIQFGNYDFDKISNNPQKDNIEIFPNQQPKNTPKFECDVPKEVQKAFLLMDLIENKELLTDEALIAEIEDIENNNLDFKSILDIFMLNKKTDFIECISEMKNISQVAKNKITKKINEILNKQIGFDKNFKKKNNKTKFKYKNYSYTSASYDITQKDENTLEIVNLNTKEKRIIDFRKLLKVNGAQDVVALKKAIQELPEDILFQIPEEVSVLLSKNTVEIFTTKKDENGEYHALFEDKDGEFRFAGGGFEHIMVSTEPATMIHELAHAIFFNKAGKDTLENNPKLAKIFKDGVEKYKQDHGYIVRDYDKDSYWTNELSDLGAEIITAMYLNDEEMLNTIDKYAPGAIEIVINAYKQRLTANDKHIKHSVEEYITYVDG